MSMAVSMIPNMWYSSCCCMRHSGLTKFGGDTLEPARTYCTYQVWYVHIVTTDHFIFFTRRFAPRVAFAASYACSGKKLEMLLALCKAGRGPWLIVHWCKLATWNCQEPRRLAPGNNPDATSMSIPFYLRFLYTRCILCLFWSLWLHSFCL